MGNSTRVTSGDGYTASGVWADSAETRHALTPTLAALQHGDHMVYALRLRDGVIKIGCTKDVANRVNGMREDLDLPHLAS